MVTVATGSKHGAYYIEETTAGETPSSPSFIALPHTSFGLQRSVDTIEDETLRPDRNRSCVRLGNVSASGDVGANWSDGNFDPFLESGMASTFGSPLDVVTDGTVDAVAASNEFTIGTSWTTTPNAGDYVKVSGFTNAANNGVFLVTAATDTSITVVGADLVDESGATATIGHNGLLTNGSTRKTFTMASDYSDVGRKEFFKGAEVDSMSISISPNSNVSLTFSMIARDVTDTEPSGATYGSQPSDCPFDSYNGFITENEQIINVVQSLDISTANNGEAQYAVGDRYAVDVTQGQFIPNGSISAYLIQNSGFVTKFWNETESSVGVVVEDAQGNAYALRLPRVTYTSGSNSVDGPGAITTEVGYEGLYDSTRDAALEIFRMQ